MELHVGKVNLGAERKSTKKIPNSFKMGTSSHRVVLFLVSLCVCAFFFFFVLFQVTRLFAHGFCACMHQAHYGQQQYV